MGEDAVESDFPVFVGVEALVKKIAQETAILRNTFAVDALRGSERLGIVLSVGSEVADGGEAESGDDGVLHDVDVFVDFSGLKAAIEMDVAIAGYKFAIESLRKLPFGAGDDGSFRISGIADRENVAGIVGSRDRIFHAADVAGDQVAQGNFELDSGGHKIAAEKSGNRLTVFFGYGGIELERVVATGVPLPAKTDDGETMAQEPGISGVVGEIPFAAVNQSDDAAVTAVGNFQKQRAVTFVSVLGADGDEVGGEFDLAIVEIDGVTEIDDSDVMGIRDGYREIDTARDAFVGSSVTEEFAIEDVGAREDFDACYVCAEWRNGGQR